MPRKLYAKKALNRLDEVDRKLKNVPNAQKDVPLSEIAPDLYLQYQKASIYTLAVAASRCVASDDPRLKEK